ncbi:uncharacterized protein LOC143672550 [Tamandua tetradactyla]|uniref:uncharacterized protein LOC143672550 n=1 Tax=Tamandua tetradactyla TaxID=48850 RepID=UPI004053DD24
MPPRPVPAFTSPRGPGSARRSPSDSALAFRRALRPRLQLSPRSLLLLACASLTCADRAAKVGASLQTGVANCPARGAQEGAKPIPLQRGLSQRSRSRRRGGITLGGHRPRVLRAGFPTTVSCILRTETRRRGRRAAPPAHRPGETAWGRRRARRARRQQRAALRRSERSRRDRVWEPPLLPDAARRVTLARVSGELETQGVDGVRYWLPRAPLKDRVDWKMSQRWRRLCRGEPRGAARLAPKPRSQPHHL